MLSPGRFSGESIRRDLEDFNRWLKMRCLYLKPMGEHGLISNRERGNH